MQPYKGYFISGNALIVHPFSPDWYVGDSVDAPDRLGSIVEVKRLQGAVFQSNEAAEKHGPKMCKEWIDGRMKARQA